MGLYLIRVELFPPFRSAWPHWAVHSSHLWRVAGRAGQWGVFVWYERGPEGPKTQRILCGCIRKNPLGREKER
jgi:hypothetical protein